MTNSRSPYRVELEVPIRPASKLDFQRFEAKCRQRIPAEYKKFLAQQNGGKPTRSCLTYGKGPYMDLSVKHFFGIRPTGHDSLQIALKVYTGRIPARTFPIAQDEGDNLVLIATDTARHGKILFWDHERELTDNKAVVVARSLPEFLQKLKPDRTPKMSLVLVQYSDGSSERKVLPYRYWSFDRRKAIDVLKLTPGERVEVWRETKVEKVFAQVTKIEE